MNIGKRIRYFRKKNGLKQKELGLKLGYSEVSAEARICQFENNKRRPRTGKIRELALLFDISPKALTVDEIDSTDIMMHTLFAIEDIYGLNIVQEGNQVMLEFSLPDMAENGQTRQMVGLLDWCKKQDEFRYGQISKTDYDHWRYNYIPAVEVGESIIRNNKQ